MKTIPLLAFTFTTTVTFICTYFYNLTLDNFEQYLASLLAVVMIRWIFWNHSRNVNAKDLKHLKQSKYYEQQLFGQCFYRYCYC
jgi:hypothetical protein